MILPLLRGDAAGGGEGARTRMSRVATKGSVAAPRLNKDAAPPRYDYDYGALQTKLAASSMLPVPVYLATCG